MKKEKKSGWDSSWTQPNSPVTDELVEKIGDVLSGLINSSPDGTWTGKIRDIMMACGEYDDLEYGTYFNALPIVRERYHIHSDSAGRNGNVYSFISSTTSNQNPSDKPQQILPKIQLSISIEHPDLSEPSTFYFTISPQDQPGKGELRWEYLMKNSASS